MTSGPLQDRAGRVLGVDAGTARVGLALSDETRTIASPLTTLPRANDRLWRLLTQEVSLHHVTRVVVGLPRRLDGDEGDAAADARSLAAEVQRRTGLPVELWDERFTTVMAEKALIADGVRRSPRRRSIDAVAAALMLQSWLDSQRRR